MKFFQFCFAAVAASETPQVDEETRVLNTQNIFEDSNFQRMLTENIHKVLDTRLRELEDWEDYGENEEKYLKEKGRQEESEGREKGRAEEDKYRKEYDPSYEKKGENKGNQEEAEGRAKGNQEEAHYRNKYEYPHHWDSAPAVFVATSLAMLAL